MPAVQNVERRGGVYYWRRTLRFRDGNSPTVRLSLRTTDQSVARRMACAMTTARETLRMKVENETKATGLTAEQKGDIFRKAMTNLRDDLDWDKTLTIATFQSAAGPITADANGEGAKSYGFEASGTVRPVKGFSVVTTVAYNHSQLRGDTGNGGRNMGDAG
jgi:hypothetical protein